MAHQQIWSVKSLPLFLSSCGHLAKILFCCSAGLSRERVPAQRTEIFLSLWSMDCWWFIKQQKVDCEILATPALLQMHILIHRSKEKQNKE